MRRTRVVVRKSRASWPYADAWLWSVPSDGRLPALDASLRGVERSMLAAVRAGLERYQQLHGRRA